MVIKITGVLQYTSILTNSNVIKLFIQIFFQFIKLQVGTE